MAPSMPHPTAAQEDTNMPWLILDQAGGSLTFRGAAGQRITLPAGQAVEVDEATLKAAAYPNVKAVDGPAVVAVAPEEPAADEPDPDPEKHEFAADRGGQECLVCEGPAVGHMNYEPPPTQTKKPRKGKKPGKAISVDDLSKGGRKAGR